MIHVEYTQTVIVSRMDVNVASTQSARPISAWIDRRTVSAVTGVRTTPEYRGKQAMHVQVAGGSRTVLVRLDPHEDLLEALQQVVTATGMRNAAIVAGVGSLEHYHVHVVETTNMPPGNIFFGEAGPYDILTVTGLVVDGKVHAHVTFSNPTHAMGGHIEPGCRVLTFAAIAMIETAEVELTGWDVRGPLAAPTG